MTKFASDNHFNPEQQQEIDGTAAYLRDSVFGTARNCLLGIHDPEEWRAIYKELKDDHCTVANDGKSEYIDLGDGVKFYENHYTDLKGGDITPQTRMPE